MFVICKIVLYFFVKINFIFIGGLVLWEFFLFMMLFFLFFKRICEGFYKDYRDICIWKIIDNNIKLIWVYLKIK